MRLKNLSMMVCLLMTASPYAQHANGASKQEKLKQFTGSIEEQMDKDAKVDSMRYWKKSGGRAPASVGDEEDQNITPTQRREQEVKELQKRRDLNLNNQTGLESF